VEETLARLSVGIVGTGFIARTHVDAFRRACILFPELGLDVAIDIVADVTLQSARGFADRMGIPNAVDDWRTLVAHPGLDLIAIAAPNNLHFPIAMAAIEKGIAVYCEKPLALNAAEADRMAAAASAREVPTFVAFNNVFAPSTQLAGAMIKRGDIGEPLQFLGSFDQGFYSDPDLPASWRIRRDEAGSGALGDLGSHVVSIAQYLVGPISSVAALDATVFRERPRAESGAGYAARASSKSERVKVENDDLAQALVQFEGGAIGTIGASRIAAGRVFGINWEVRGTEGTLYVENERSNELHVFRMSDSRDDRGFKTILCGSQVDGFRQGFFGFDYGGGGIGYFDVKVLEVRGMLAAFGKPGRWFCDFEFGRQNQAVVDAIAASAKAGGTIRKVVASR
jgi:predicted dehydrogenase